MSQEDLPHLTDPASLQDRHTDNQTEGTDTQQKGKQPTVKSKRTFTTSQAPTTQTTLLTTDGFTTDLGALPPDDWYRTSSTDRTIMLTRTSKRVKEVVDKMRLSACRIVHLNQSN